MLTTSFIAYNHNTFLKDQKGLGYVGLVSMIERDFKWIAGLHPREQDNSWLELSQRVAKMCIYELQTSSQVLILGGDESGVAIFSEMKVKDPVHIRVENKKNFSESMDHSLEAYLSKQFIDSFDFECQSKSGYLFVDASLLRLEDLKRYKVIYVYDVHVKNAEVIYQTLMKSKGLPS